MKLRNKKTGDRYTLGEDMHIAHTGNGSIEVEIVLVSGGFVREYFDSLAEFNEEWEDNKEPLIKDDKIRKAVRAWAEANDVTSIVVFDCNNGVCLKVDEIEFAENGGRVSISFNTSEKIDTNKAYTIAELCGEGEQ